MAGVALVAVAACGPPPELDSELKTAASWTATMRLAAEERRAGATSVRYTADLRDRALEARGETAATLATLARSPEEQRHARAALDSLDGAIRDVAALVGPR